MSGSTHINPEKEPSDILQETSEPRRISNLFFIAQKESFRQRFSDWQTFKKTIGLSLHDQDE